MTHARYRIYRTPPFGEPTRHTYWYSRLFAHDTQKVKQTGRSIKTIRITRTSNAEKEKNAGEAQQFVSGYEAVDVIDRYTSKAVHCRRIPTSLTPLTALQDKNAHLPVLTGTP